MDVGQASTRPTTTITARPWPLQTSMATGDSTSTSSTRLGKSALFRNLGGGRFEDVTDQAGVRHRPVARASGAAFADIDNDGDSDLYVTCVRDGNLLVPERRPGPVRRHHRQCGSGGIGTHSSGAVFFDYDGDGLLDLFVTNVGRYTRDDQRANGLWASMRDAFAGHLHPERSETSVLYRNLGGGRFENVSDSPGLVHSAWSGEATAFDHDGDGRPDLYVLSMQGHDEFWRNLGGGRFEKCQPPGVSRDAVGGNGRAGARLEWRRPPGPLRHRHAHGHVHRSRARGGSRASTTARRSFRPTSSPPTGTTSWATPCSPTRAAGVHRGVGRGQRRNRLAMGPERRRPECRRLAGPLRGGGHELPVSLSRERRPPERRRQTIRARRIRPWHRAANALVVPWFELDCDGADVQQDICQGEAGAVLAEDTRTPEQRLKSAPRHGRVTCGLRAPAAQRRFSTSMATAISISSPTTTATCRRCSSAICAAWPGALPQGEAGGHDDRTATASARL